MGSGSYSFAAYSCLANEREYSTKSADAVFKNRSLSAKSDIKLSNINARTIMILVPTFQCTILMNGVLKCMSISSP